MEKQIVAELIKEIAENFKVEAEKQYIDYRLSQIAKHHIGDGKYIFPFPNSGYDYRQKAAYTRRQEIIRFFKSTTEKIETSPVELGYEYKVDRFNKITVYDLLENFYAMIKEEAVKYAHDVVEGWKDKQIEKYNEVVDSKKGVKGTVKKAGHLSSNIIRFDWEDGSGFTVQNQVVVAVSNLGTFFNRFPTTFHNVTLAGGEKMKQPSEAKVKKAFINKVVKPANAPVVHLESNARYHKGKKTAACSTGSAMGEQRFLYSFGKMTTNREEVTCKRCLKIMEGK